MKMKDMLPDERPVERAFRYGTEALSDTELLAVILRTGTSGKSVLELASDLLTIEKGANGIGNLMSCTYRDFMKLPGIGRCKAVTLASVCELSKRFSRASFGVREDMTDPSAAAAYCMESMRYLDREMVCILLTDTRGRLIRSCTAALGCLDSASVSPREIMKLALENNAAGLIVVHNHPSGDPEPSREDISFSRAVRDAGKLLNIRVNDSIIIGNRKYVSLFQKGLL